MFLVRTVLCAALLASVWLPFANGQEAVDCQKRAVLINVVDHEGNLVRGLGPTEFRAELRKRPLKILSNTATSAPRRVVILVDLSGSTSRVEGFVHSVAKYIATSMRPEKQRPAVVLFSDHIIESIDFSRPAEQVARTLAELPETKGRTALFDALKYAADMFGPPLPGDSVFLISDGGEDASKTRQKDVEEEFLAKKIRIFSFNLAENEPFLTEEESNGPALLKHLADLTGAVALSAMVDSSKPNREHVASAVQLLYQQMADFYMLQLELPAEPIQKPEQWNLEVLDGQSRKRKDVRVIYPHELAPCSIQAAAGATPH